MVRFDRTNSPRTVPDSPIWSPPSIYHIPEALPSRVAYDVIDRASNSPELPTEFLVRTAQASRLRRRGAIRIENNLISSGNNPSRLDATFSEHTNGAQQNDQTSSFSPILLSEEDIGTGVSLYCGGFVSPLYSNAAYRPSPMPSFPMTGGDTTHPSTSNGCGSIVHQNAFASKRLRLWTAQGLHTQNVIALGSAYFDSPNTRINAGTAKCGCTQEGLGCSNCGNTLGVVLTPCHHHTLSRITQLHLFDPSTVSHNSNRAIPFPHEYATEQLPRPCPRVISQTTPTALASPANSQTPRPPSPIFTPAVILLSPTPLTYRTSPLPMTPPRPTSRASRRTSLRNILPPPLSSRQAPLTRRASAPPIVIPSPLRLPSESLLSPIPQDSPRLVRSYTSLQLEGIPLESRLQLRRESPVQDEAFLSISSPRQEISDHVSDTTVRDDEHHTQMADEPQLIAESSEADAEMAPATEEDLTVSNHTQEDSQETIVPDDLDPEADSKSSVCDSGCD